MLSSKFINSGGYIYPKTKITPWAHQVEGWNLAKNHSGFYYAVDMGGGKTKMGIDYSTGIDARLVLIICPKKVIPVWPRQFDQHCGVPFKVLPLDQKITVSKKAILVENEIHQAQTYGLRLAIVTNYEAFYRPPIGPTYNTKTNRMIDLGLFLRYQWDLVIYDEAHRLMSAGGRQSWNAKRLRKAAKRVLMLSGTPMPSAPINIYAQYRALDISIFGSRLTDFRKRYCVMGGYEDRTVVKYINLDELHSKFYSIAYRVMMDDVLDLPGVIHERLECKLAPKARRIYDQLEEKFVAQVDTGEVTVGNALTKLLRLSQIAGGFATLDEGKGITQIDTDKMDTMIEKIEDLGQEPVIIFYRFKPEVKEMKKRIVKIKIGEDAMGKAIYRIPGEISGDRNDEQLWIDKKIDTLCLQIKAGGEGLDSLQARARYGFFYSKGMLSSGGQDQAVKRLKRPGQKFKTFFYHLVTENTVDVKVERAIKTGGNIINDVLEDYKTRKPFASVRKAA